MSQKRGSEEAHKERSLKEVAQKEFSQTEISWEEAVLRYLEEQPDFLLRHPDLFAKLTLKHDVGGRAVSLIEHQVQTLRTRNQDINQQLRDLVNVARDNDALSARLHRFATAMIGAGSPDEALDSAADLLRQEFRVDAVVMRLKREPVGARPEYAGADDRRLNELLKRFDGTKPLLDLAHDEKLQRYLFGEHAAEVKACALVPLGSASAEGVLALGSHDAARFHPGMGTVYLARLGELLSRALAVTAG